MIKSSLFNKMMIAMSILLGCYFVATLYNSDFWGNILSPLNGFAAAGILMYTYINTDRKTSTRIIFLMCSLACISWALGDTLWAVLDFSGIDPIDNTIINLLYIMTNCFILASLTIFAALQFSKWNSIQLCVDFFIIGFLTLMLIWIAFFKKDISALHALLQLGFIPIFAIIVDVLIIIGVLSWYLSIRSGNITIFIRLFSFGAILFAVIDLYCNYLYVNLLYNPNSLIDFAYMVSLQLMAFGSLLKVIKKDSLFDLETLTNTGNKKNWIYSLLYPLIAVCIEGFIWTDLTIFAFVIFLYVSSCNYIQMAIENETLLKNEKIMNYILEKRVEEQISELKFLANQDTLTTLYNRRYFFNHLEESINTLYDNDLLAVLFIDLDRFKTINDNFGHHVGDKLLVALSDKLVVWNTYNATLARLGGDEFAVMFAGKYTLKEIEDFCEQIIELCSKPISIDDEILQVTISIGVSLYSSKADNGTTLMKNADIAMYRAKSQGYNKYQFYDSFFSDNINKNSEIEILLKQADIEKDFELYYQPQFSLPDRKLIGAEALIRWESTEHGYISPSEFIRVAEEINYISKIGKWVMEKTIGQAVKWNTLYPCELKIGFNVSPKQLSDEYFADNLKLLLKDGTVNSSWIDAEITESIMIEDHDKVISIFNLFNDLGITVSIDDFGSGYSSLAYLNKYHFNRIKIDRSLIDNLYTKNCSGTHVVKAIIAMAKAVGIKTIAEGVETEEQLNILIELGCDQIQGYLLGKPVPSDVFEENFIKKQFIPDIL